MGRGVALGGFMGSGKTTVGARLADRIGLPFVDMDAVLVERGRVIAEGAGACSVACALAGGAGSGRVVCVISGGNIDEGPLRTALAGQVPS